MSPYTKIYARLDLRGGYDVVLYNEYDNRVWTERRMTKVGARWASRKMLNKWQERFPTRE